MATLLPEPDSPTMPSTSPSSTLNDTPSTARSRPCDDGNSTTRLSISITAITSPLQLGIERVAQAVAEEVEGQHGDQDHDAGEGDDPPGAQHEFAGVGEHG